MSKTYVTDIQQEKDASKGKFKKPWEDYYSKADWDLLSPEFQETFLHKQIIIEILMDFTNCMVEHKSLPRKPKDPGSLFQLYTIDLLEKLRGLSQIVIRKINDSKNYETQVLMLEDYESVISQKETHMNKILQENYIMKEKLSSLTNQMKADQLSSSTSNLNLKSIQEDCRKIIDDFSMRIKERDAVIEALNSKLNITDQRNREFRFKFSNVAQTEDKLKKMETMYIKKLENCFTHYSK